MVDGPESGRENGGGVARPAKRFRLPLAALTAVFVGGTCGTLARYGVEVALPHTDTGWPVGTFAVNVVGAFVLGLLLENLAARGREGAAQQQIRLLLGTGFCGAFTTYSTFALETVTLTRHSQWPTALAYALTTVVLGIAAARAGIALGAARRVR
ncbi:MAG: fluoride efflux transporter CrcB [Rhodococcus sp. (in: high G+C Gram-positive bacteria)]